MRFIRGLGDRVATEDVAALEFLNGVERALDDAWAVAVAGLRGGGYTDREIGAQLGISRQAVEQKWPR